MNKHESNESQGRKQIFLFLGKGKNMPGFGSDTGHSTLTEPERL